jgi:hypothetical protein
MWRGADDSLQTTEFFWRSPDGSEVLTIHKPKGYGSGATLPQNTRALLGRIQAIRDDLEPLATTPYVLVMNGSDHLPPQPELSSMPAPPTWIEGAVLEHSSLPGSVPQRPALHRRPRGEGPCTPASSAAASARTCCLACSRRACGSQQKPAVRGPVDALGRSFRDVGGHRQEAGP